jgi:competence ComEA-like helix-hairpin-helix protein
MLAFPAVGAAGQLPEGAGREETARLCGACHEAERASALRLSREGWQEEVARMAALGMKGSDDEVAKVVTYLAEHFKGEAPRPLNLNRATSVELESIVGLLRKESAAWIAYRTKVGPCKTLDDLKKVEGVPFQKIDERRDRLVCF